MGDKNLPKKLPKAIQVLFNGVNNLEENTPRIKKLSEINNINKLI